MFDIERLLINIINDGRMVSLKVDNLTYRTTNEDLEYLFEKFGKVGDVEVLL